MNKPNNHPLWWIIHSLPNIIEDWIMPTHIIFVKCFQLLPCRINGYVVTICKLTAFDLHFIGFPIQAQFRKKVYHLQHKFNWLIMGVNCWLKQEQTIDFRGRELPGSVIPKGKARKHYGTLRHFNNPRSIQLLSIARGLQSLFLLITTKGKNRNSFLAFPVVSSLLITLWQIQKMVLTFPLFPKSNII